MKFLTWGISFLLLLFTRSEVKCQELLNANVKQIKDYMKNQEGILKKEGVTLDIITNTKGNELMFEFPSSKIRLTGIYMAVFSFSKNDKCIHYMTWYSNNKYMPALIKKFDNSKSDYRRINKALSWTLKTNDKIVTSIMTTNSSGKNTMFILDVLEKTGNTPYKSKIVEQLEKAMKQAQAERH
jgi:hypothetical protein